MTESAKPSLHAPFSLAWFESALDSTFDVSSDGAEGAAFALRLVEVNRRSAPVGWEQFSAIFIGPAAPVFAQGTYRFAHAALGELDIFMAPVGRDTAGIQYEVCVSRDTRTAAK
jgi:hypothetical protein